MTDQTTSKAIARSQIRLPRLNSDVVALGTLLAIVVANVIFNLWNRYQIARLDTLTQFLPWYQHLGERLRDFDLPGWLPYSMSGAPFAGDPQSGWGYLPAMLFFTISPSIGGFSAFHIFHGVLAAAGSYGYARTIGMGPIGAVATGAAFTLGNFSERTACCNVHMQLAVWIPAILFCFERALVASTTQRRLLWLIGAGIGTGQMISGWLGQGAYYGVLAIGIYVGYRLILSQQEGWGLRERFRLLVVTGIGLVVIGGATAAPALIPRLDTVSRSNLADLYGDGVTDQRTFWELEALPNYIYSYGPRTQRWYLGAVLIPLFFMACVLCWRRRHVPFFVFFSICTLGLTIRDFPLTKLFNLLPRFESLHSHAPDRIFLVLYLAPAVVVGWLVDSFWTNRWGVRNVRLVAALALLAGAGIMTVFLVQIHRFVHYWVRHDRVTETVAVMAVVAVAAMVGKPAVRQVGAAAIVALLIFDPAGQLFLDRLENDRQWDRRDVIVDGILDVNGAARWLQGRVEADEQFRYFGYDQAQLMNEGAIRTYHVSYADPATHRILVNNRGVSLKIEDVQGYNPIQIQRYVEFIESVNGVAQSYHSANVLASGLRSPLLDQLNIRYIVVPAEVPPGRPDLLWLSQNYATVYADASTRILENTEALPRAWIVHEAESRESGEAILSVFALGLEDPRTTVLLEGDAPELQLSTDAAAESVKIVEQSPDQIHLEVDVSARGMVVLSEIWDPDWSATVDGEKADVLRVNHALRGIIVDPGQHKLVLRHEPAHVRASLLFYLIPLAALIGVLVLGKKSLAGLFQRLEATRRRVTAFRSPNSDSPGRP